MSYSVNIKHSAEKELKPIPESDREKIISAILGFRENPFPKDIKKLENKDGYRLRIGNYRILYTVNLKEKTIDIYSIGHRKEIYRKRS
jgi:mRNA interferase RelE/StbE